MNSFISRAVAYVKRADLGGSSSKRILDDDSSPVLLPVSEGLVLAYVVDEPEGLVFVQKHHLRTAGISDAELHLVAIKNLGQMCADKLQIKKHGPIYGVYLEGNFEASLFVLKSLWQRDLAHLVDKGFAICLPARDILAFCDIDSTEGIATMRQMIDRAFKGGDHLLTKAIFQIRKESV